MTDKPCDDKETLARLLAGLNQTVEKLQSYLREERSEMETFERIFAELAAIVSGLRAYAQADPPAA